MTFDEKVNKVINKLNCTGDYTCYHKKHILAVCYEVFCDAPVRWQKIYNSHPIPQFNLDYGYNDFKIDINKINWINGSYFYNVDKDTIIDAVNIFK